jgi:hypothetical protein
MKIFIRKQQGIIIQFLHAKKTGVAKTIQQKMCIRNIIYAKDYDVFSLRGSCLGAERIVGV